ncbi:hypothetical protein LEL_08912 [Akanthomyces lecanii RCEF 1005]|uniref:Cell wall galactomannoprotein n=1 Tax=Akanthomyces lecanii RCEF 1005 TaxID=1081108 RepID=A0A168CQT7_CORDF|nr:hypothetical protein LEL_08912 [Akanthomyces lecanii RCEF 1005]
MLIVRCFLLAIALACPLASAVPTASVLPENQTLKMLKDLGQDVQRYSAVIKTNAVAQNALSPEDGNSDSINATRDALNGIIASILETTKSLESTVAENGSTFLKSPTTAFDVGVALRNMVVELGSMSTTVSGTSTALFLAGSFEDILHVVFSALLALVNVVGGLLVGIPGIEPLLRAIAALVSLFP